MGIEMDPNDSIYWYQMGAFPIARVQIYIRAATELGIPYELISNDDDRVKSPTSFMRAGEGEQIIRVDYGNRHSEFWNRVHEISPPPPPKEPIGTASEKILLEV